MKKSLLLLATMASMLCGANAQSRLSTATKMLLSEQTAAGNSSLINARSPQAVQRVLTTIRLTKGATVTDQQLAALDIQVERRCGTLIFANVPINKLAELAEIEGISNVDTGAKSHPLNDKAREATFVSMVHDMNAANSTADLPQHYSGKDVLVAIIDMDVDLAHPAFRDAAGKYRIKHAEQYLPIRNEDGHYVTQHFVYDEDQIDEAILFLEDFELKGTGHGTHVTGTAAGSTAALPADDPMKDYYGIAHESDLLVYDITGVHAEILNSLADAFEQADRMQRPLVVNMSLGRNDAQLDGTDEFNVNLKALVENYDMAGKIICVSAGNEADSKISAQMDCTDPIVDDDWTLQHVLSCIPVDDDDSIEQEDGTIIYQSRQWFTFYAADNRDFGVQYIMMDPTCSEAYAATPIIAASACLDENSYSDSGDTPTSDRYEIQVSTWAECSLSDRTYLMSNVTFTSATPYRVVAAIYTLSEGMQIDGAVSGGYFDAATSTAPVNNWGSINQLLCNDICIGVGAYGTRLDIEPINYPAYSEPGEVGDITNFSSYCHPHYGPMNPLCAAPGLFLLSAMHHNIDPELAYLAGASLYEGNAFPWAYDAGTSMASPVVTGIMALWLQANPDLTREDVVEILSKTCDYDEFCQASPLCFGYGKINAKRGMDYILDHTVGLTSVGHDTDVHASKYIDARGHIMIRKGEHNYDVMGVSIE